ncbi:MAG: hypothetical protein AAFO91_02105 [Bacteroidota bacterium]
METSLNEMFIDPNLLEDTLAGMGLSGNPIARRTANAVVKNLRHVVTREQILLSSLSKDFPLQTLQLIQKKELRLEEFQLTLRVQVKAGDGNPQILLGNNADAKEVPGIKNIEGNALGEHENMIVTKVRIAHATHASITNPAALVYKNSGTDVPAAIRNSKLVLRISEKRKFETQLAMYFNIGGSYAATPGHFDLQTLKAPFSIPAKQDIELQYIDIPGLSLTNNHFLEIQFIGMRTIAG